MGYIRKLCLFNMSMLYCKNNRHTYPTLKQYIPHSFCCELAYLVGDLNDNLLSTNCTLHNFINNCNLTQFGLIHYSAFSAAKAM